MAAALYGVGDLDAARRSVIEPARPAASLGRHDGSGRDRDGVHDRD